MRSLRLFFFALVALAQLSVPAWAIWMRNQTLTRGKEWKFRAAPVDPVDAIRGRYVALDFVAERFPRSEALPAGSFAYALLKEGGTGFAEIDHLESSPVHGDNVIKVRVAGWWENDQHVKEQHIKFPFDRFWVSEKVAPEAERAYAANSTRQKENVYVTVRVRDGDAALEELYIDGQPLVEYLRNHPAH
jgi:uncharacterized membrane-anchored protein